MSLDEKPPKEKRTGRKTRGGAVPSEAKVVSLFGPDATKRNDPDQVVPERDRKSPEQNHKRINVSGRWAEVYRKINAGEITMKEFVKSLSPEELARGQMKDKNGGWSGAPPKWVPAELHQECVRELLRRGDELWRSSYVQAIETMTKIATTDGIEVKDRMKAAIYVIERLAGKTPERVELSVVDPWEQIVTGIVAEAEDNAISRAARIMAGDNGEPLIGEG
jgi:hypothetical protein